MHRIVDPLLLCPSSWANGAGITRVIEVRNTGIQDAPTDYAWRLSMAELDRDTEFSPLPGIDRTFALVFGGPLTMTVDAVPRILSKGHTQMFGGESRVSVRLPDARLRLGLNLMTRRRRCSGELTVERHQGSLRLDPAAGEAAAMLIEGKAALADGTPLRQLSVLIPGQHPEELLCEDADIAIITVSALSGNDF
jgi:environmental stress-induced protein Ves